jgi:hypothetical protein
MAQVTEMAAVRAGIAPDFHSGSGAAWRTAGSVPYLFDTAIGGG